MLHEFEKNNIFQTYILGYGMQFVASVSIKLIGA